MRLLELTITGFGSYRGTTHLPLAQMGEEGLFMINGDTGSGKTLLVDAITYAFYGRPSGRNRSAGMLRSQLSEEDAVTEVKLIFSCKGKEYTVKRSPEYTRRKKKGTGTTVQSAVAELTMPDGSIITNRKEVDERIKEIIGLDGEQFVRIAVLPQGDFTEVLNAGTAQRQELFRTLFNTEPYARLTDRVKALYLAKNKEYTDTRDRLIQYLADVQTGDNEAVSDRLENVKEGKEPLNLVPGLMKELVELDERNKAFLEQGLKKTEKELELVKNEIAKAEGQILLQAALENSREQKQLAVRELDQAERALEEKKDTPVTIKDLEGRIALLREKLPKYDELEEITTVLKDLQQKIHNDENTCRQQESDLKSAKVKLTEMVEERNSYDGMEDQLVKLERDQEYAKAEGKELVQLSEHLVKCEVLRKQHNKAKEKYKETREKYDEGQKRYTALNKAYMDHQAGVLADRLKEGEACPVCGSPIHPCPAKGGDEAPTEKEVDEAKAGYEKAMEQVSEATGRAREAGGLLEAQEELTLQKIHDLLGSFTMEAAGGEIEERQKAVGIKLRGLEESIAKAEKHIKRRKKLEKDIESEEGEIAVTDELLTRLKEKLAGQRARCDEVKKQYEALQASLEYPGKAEITEAIDTLEDELEEINRDFNTAVRAQSEAKNKLSEAEGKIASLEGQLEGTQTEDTEEKRSREDALKKEKEGLQEEINGLKVRASLNRNILQRVEKDSRLLDLTEGELSSINSLNQTIGGTITGKEKITLEAYVQAMYFDRIVFRANKRLQVMSDGRFRLARRTKATHMGLKSGLELDIIDHHTGRERDVKTLSGGESFMAALSLALGLSDEIQENAGGIQLETMFVDEGFGTLDDTALQQALKALVSVTEGKRLVGIISHVSELKDKIQKQIIVKKDAAGESTAEIIV